ncbi:FAD-dependent oxidoreductase [Pseudomonas sp. H11T01]|uniref:FAD-dependent oxidoreductase n=1 Tax=Pseudomonas sp. H11T01 TaxID=3402749 RepID=UPI003AC2CFFE
MPHVITQNCCNDAACVPVCPVGCIHPAPDEADYASAEMLYIDPDICIDCGACSEACPVGAIALDIDIQGSMTPFIKINADFYKTVGTLSQVHPSRWTQGRSDARESTAKPQLKVAVVGAGPAGYYAASELLRQADVPVSVDMFDRLCTPGGLVRFGVAPDHQHTKNVQHGFARTMADPRVRSFFNVEVGRDISHEELVARYHAVIYAYGAMQGKQLGLVGENLTNSVAAAEFVAWYNGHPDFANRAFDLSGHRAVVLGNGNVALDVARVLVADPSRLAKTDIADHALAALRESNIREVVVVARRGAADAAFTAAELIGLSCLEELDVVVDAAEISDPSHGVEAFAPATQFARDLKISLLRDLAAKVATKDRRIVLKFLAAPAQIEGAEAVTGVRLIRNEHVLGQNNEVVIRHTDQVERLECSLVLRAVGYRGSPIAGVPFDESRGVVPNIEGRVLESREGAPVPGLYVTGWIKRGPSGVIGTNKQCASQTVMRLLEDFAGGQLSIACEEEVSRLLPDAIGAEGARAIDTHEIASGSAKGRPRVKLVDRSQLLEIAGAPEYDA